MDYFNTLNHYNNIYPMECHEPDPYLWDYEQAKYVWWRKLNMYAELQMPPEAYSETIRETWEQQASLINQIFETVAKAHDIVKEFVKEAQRKTT